MIGGEEYKSRKLRGRYIKINSGFEILIGEKAIESFGKQAKDGVVIVPEGEIVDDFARDAKQLKDRKNFSIQYFLVSESGKPNYVKLYSNVEPDNVNTDRKRIVITEEVMEPGEEDENVIMIKKNKENGKTTYEYKLKDTLHTTVYNKLGSGETQIKKEVKLIQKDGEPIYIINGEIDEDFEEGDLMPEQIQTINIYKDEMAVAKYGKKAENGVVRIYTKDFVADNMDEKLFVIKADFNDSRLEALKNEVKRKTGFNLTLKNITRNKEGLISKIEVKFQGDTQMAAGTYVEEDGINDIQFGIQGNGGVIISTMN